MSIKESSMGARGRIHLFIAGIQMVAILHATIMIGRNLLGLDFASHKLPGSWPMRYPT